MTTDNQTRSTGDRQGGQITMAKQMTDKPAQQGLSDDELAQQQASDLPDREAMTTLLDLNADLDLALDLAAPIDAAVAANANAAIPLDASVGANVLSANSAAVSSAHQDAPISQSLEGIATANANQDADVTQGGLPTDAATSTNP
jgi:hypothetical protein